MTNRELLEFTLKVNIGTCNEIYTKINRQLDEKSDIDLALVRYFNTLVSINHKVQDVLYKERENLNIPTNLRENIESMRNCDKTDFILNAFNIRYTNEWKYIYDAFAIYVSKVIRKYDYECDISSL